MLSPFGERIKRARQDIALFRNEFVAALATWIFIAYAAPGGKTDSFSRKLLGWGKPVFTFDTPSNDALLSSGVLPYKGLKPFSGK